MKYLSIAFFLFRISALAQTPQVPHKLQFAGMTLSIRDDARREIQKDVDALTQSPRHFNIKVERARTYFPIIERIFEEERLPDDFKYLVLQESALIPDAVSVSRAVGFWQFKDFTAIEMGLRVDKEIDERMNVVSSTRAAARYIKKNNFFFNNWLYALQAYQMGAGGVMQEVKDPKSGATHMEITSRTYWYVKKYLAHKIAFEGAVEGPGELQVAAVVSTGKESLKAVARELSMTEDELLSYNKWVRRNTIPDDKEYAIVVPLNDVTREYLASAKMKPASGISVAETGRSRSATPVTASVQRAKRVNINGVPAVQVMPGENAAAFASRNGIGLSYFLRCNDIPANTRLNPGGYYFVSRKRSRAEKDYHKVTEGESLWQISQQYGVKLKKLLRFNRLAAGSGVSPGSVVYLSGKRPKNAEAGVQNEDVLQVDTNSLFTWSLKPEPPSEIGNPTPEPQAEIAEAESNTQPNRQVPDTLQANNASTVEEQPSNGFSSLGTVDPGHDGIQRQHEVLAGETLYGISREYGVDVMDLVNWNNLNLNDGIKPGQVLKLSGRSEDAEAAKADNTKSSPSVELIHEVRATDTLYGVARKYGVTIKEIMEWNNKTDFNIHLGEKLKIKQ